MDGIKVLIDALRGTLNPDQKAIREAEAFLNNLSSQAGYATALMQIMMMQTGNQANTSGMTLELPVRQAAAIAFKNLIRRHWRSREDSTTSTLSDSDKATVKANIFDVLCLAEPLIKKQLAVSIQTIADTDYPEQWPDMLQKLLTYTKSGNITAVYSSLLALNAIFASFGFCERDSLDGQILDAAIRETFPSLAEIVKATQSTPVQTPDVAKIDALLLKILNHATHGPIPKSLCDENTLFFWMSYTKAVLEKPLGGFPANTFTAANADIWWKAPTRASELVARLLVRYGARKDVSNKALRKGTEGLRTKFFPSLIKPFETMVLRAAELEVPERLEYMSYSYLANSVMYKHPYAVLKGDLNDLIQKVAFPRLCATQDDLNLATEEPVEYLRREFDCTNLFSSPRQGANELIINACKFRPEFLMPVMVFLSQTLQAATSGGDAARKYGALTLVASLEGCIKGKEPFAREIEPMLTRFVVPELFSAHAALRAVAAFCMGRYCDIQWTNQDTFTQALRRILEMSAATEEAQLAPSVYSAMSLKYFVQTPVGQELMRPGLDHILNIFYRFIDRVDLDLDDLVMALEVFVEIYGEGVAPHAKGICEHLIGAFSATVNTLVSSISGSFGGEGEDLDGLILKAISCLETLGTILISIHGVPDLFREIGITLAGIFGKILSEVCSDNGEVFNDYLEEVLSLVQLITFWTRPTPPEYWPLFPLLCKVFEHCGSEYMSDLLAPLDNFISFGTDVFLSNPANMEMIYSMCTAVISDDNADELESLKACQLAESVFHHCKGESTDIFVTKVLELAIARLRSAHSRIYKVFLIELIANGLYYNAQLTFRVLEATGATQFVFTTWGQLKDMFSRTYDKKISVVGLSSIFRMQGNTLPPIVQAAIPNIIGLILYFLTEVEKQYRSKKRTKKKKNYSIIYDYALYVFFMRLWAYSCMCFILL